MSEQTGKLMNIKEIEEKMNRSLTIGDETMKDVFMTYVSPYEIEFLLTRIKALEGVLRNVREVLKDLPGVRVQANNIPTDLAVSSMYEMVDKVLPEEV